MPTHIAFLRAVNVGGTGKLPMAELRAMAQALGFEQVRTHIASGNLIFSSDAEVGACRTRLEAALHDYAGKAVPVLMRSPSELRALLEANPYPDAAGNRCLVYFLDQPPPDGWQDAVRHRGDEVFSAVGREIFVHYGDGMGASRLVIPALAPGTGRNLNTVRKVLALAEG
jgi:uncharacterized protein (DUF1697 family)